MEVITFSVQSTKVSEDGKTVWATSPDKHSARVWKELHRDIVQKSVGKELSFQGDWKPTKTGGKYFNVEAILEKNPQDTPKQESSPVKQQTSIPVSDGKNRAFALSYSKDLLAAGKLMKGEVLVWASVFEKFLNGDITVEDKKVTEALMRGSREES
jgi:hypothetical protein